MVVVISFFFFFSSYLFVFVFFNYPSEALFFSISLSISFLAVVISHPFSFSHRFFLLLLFLCFHQSVAFCSHLSLCLFLFQVVIISPFLFLSLVSSFSIYLQPVSLFPFSLSDCYNHSVFFSFSRRFFLFIYLLQSVSLLSITLFVSFWLA